MYLIGFLIVGAVVGLLAGFVMTGPGYGIFWDMVAGAVGALVCGLALSLVFGSYFTGLVIAYLGAVVVATILVAILHLVTGERPHVAR